MSRGFDDLHDDAHRNGDSAPHQDAEVEPADADVAPIAAAANVPDGDRASAPVEQPQPAAPVKPMSPTPIGIERPLDLPEREIDPDVLAAAMAELDAELGMGRDRRPQATD